MGAGAHESTTASFKWTDWCQSMGLDFGPHRLVNAARWGDLLGLRSPALERIAGSLFEAHLRRVASRCRPVLSAADVHAEKLERLEIALEQLRSDVAAGDYTLDR